MAKRKESFTVETPLQEAEFVTLFEDTWKDHIELNHPELQGKENNVYRTLQTPTFISKATNPDTNFAFLNTGDIDEKGQALMVVVNPVDNQTGKPFVASAYYTNSNKFNLPDRKLWPK
jgi:hypothetical protein